MSDKPNRELLPGEAEVDAWVDSLKMPEDIERVQRTPEQADDWLKDLMEHIKKQHPHLAKRWWDNDR